MVRKEYYRIKEGQTLYDVAEVFSVPPTLIIAENKLTRWQAGMVIRIPEAGELTPVFAGETAETLGGEAFLKRNGTKIVFPTLPVWK